MTWLRRLRTAWAQSGDRETYAFRYCPDNMRGPRFPPRPIMFLHRWRDLRELEPKLAPEGLVLNFHDAEGRQRRVRVFCSVRQRDAMVAAYWTSIRSGTSPWWLRGIDR